MPTHLFGYDVHGYVIANFQFLLNCAMVPVGVLLFGLFIQAATRTSALWYQILEKCIGIAFVGIAASCIYFLPITFTAIKVYAVWYLVQVALFAVLPGKIYEGLPLKGSDPKNPTKLRYKCNGLKAFVITMVLYFAGGYYGWFKYTILYDNFVSLLAVTNIFSFGFAFFLYFKGMKEPGHVSRGNFPEDLWYGVELNPIRNDALGLDLKFFSESRPGLILWVLMNFSIAAAQYEQLGYITVPMYLVSIFHFIYIFDYFVLENYIVTTWDIFEERFGWMLLWGDYVWVPYFYCLQAFWMLYNTREFSTVYYVLNVAVFLLGYITFRGANRQKHKFKENPDGLIWGKKPEVIVTKRGTKLLISGFWGLARHVNYLGDLILAFSWGMTAGFDSYIPYLYLAFMTGLLLHRFARDDERCAEKYGDDWVKYCKAVPYKLIPYIF